MSGDEKAEMTNKEMQEHFEKMVTDHALDTDERIRGAMDKIDGLEGTLSPICILSVAGHYFASVVIGSM